MLILAYGTIVFVFDYKLRGSRRDFTIPCVVAERTCHLGLCVYRVEHNIHENSSAVPMDTLSRESEIEYLPSTL